MIELDFTSRVGSHEVSLRVSSATSVVLVQGASGAGKTTALRAICGLTPAQGRIRLGGRVWTSRSGFLRPATTIGYVPQAGGAFLGQTLRRNIELVAADPSSADRWLERCGLSGLALRRVDELSGGQVRRMAVARALATEAGAFVFDEPFAGLDGGATQELISILARHIPKRSPLFISSHTGEDALADTFASGLCLAPVIYSPGA